MTQETGSTTPQIPICDAHIHLFAEPRSVGSHDGAYRPEDFAKEVESEPSLTNSVFINAGTNYRKGGPEAFRPVGETEWVCAQAPTAPIATGIVSFVDLTLGEEIDDVLAAHIEAGQGRFRGVRYATAWDASPEIPDSLTNPPAGMLGGDALLAGLRVLARRGLTFDAFLYFTQLEDVIRCADRVSDLPIVIDHLGGPLGTGPYANRKEEVRSSLLAGLKEVAKRETVTLKLSGTGIPRYGWKPPTEGTRATAEEVVQEWGSLIRACIEIFGPSRCMFGSNYPPDSGVFAYHDLWSAYRMIAADYSPAEQADLLHGTAIRFYGLPQTASAR